MSQTNSNSLNSFNHLLNSIPDSVIIISDDLNIIVANKFVENLFLYSHNELNGTNFNGLITESEALSKDDLLPIDEENANILYVNQIKKDGTLFPSAIRISLYDRERKLYYVSVRDVTYRTDQLKILEEAKDKLEQNEKRLQIAQEASKSGSWEWDMETDIHYWSEALISLFQAEPCEKYDFDSWRKIVHKDDLPEVEYTFGKAIEDKTDYLCDYRIVLPNKSIKWIRAFGRTMYEDNVAKKMVGLCIDISDQKKFDEELIRAKDLAEAANRAKSSFLANMSHEIRTPLHGILGFTQLLSQKNITDNERVQYAEIISSSGTKLLKIVNNILDLAKIKSGMIESITEPIDLQQLCLSVLCNFQKEAIEKGISLETSVEKVNNIVNADSKKLTEVANNIMGNAIKYTKSGTISFKYTIIGQKIIFSITDSGIGIEKDKLKYIFEDFIQGEESETKNYGGTGLGLAISKELMNHMGGKIWVQSEIGKGSTFFFSIPYEPVQW